MHKNHELIESKSIFPIEPGPIVDKPNPFLRSLASLLHRLHVNLCRQNVFSNDTYRSIIDTHDRVQIFLAESVLIRVQLVKFPFGNVEVLHTRRTNLFSFLQEFVMVPSESDIPTAPDIRSFVISPHVPWYSIPVDLRAPALYSTFFAASKFRLAPVLLHP